MQSAAAQNGLLIVMLTLAVVWDVRTHRIPNKLSLPVLALGFVLNGIRDGAHGLLFALAGLAVAGISLLFWALGGGLGAGDVKLLWAVGALMGPVFAAWTLLGTALAGGLLALAYALKRGTPAQTVAAALFGGQWLLLTRSPKALKRMAEASPSGRMPYAPAIALGAAAASLLSAGVRP